MKRLAILGASGHGKVVADIALLSGWDEIDFFDDDWPALNCVGCWSVVGGTKDLVSNITAYSGVIVAIGNNSIRAVKQKLLASHGAKIVSLIHPSASISSYAALGLGSVVMANVSINPYVKSGISVIFNTGCNIDHDCVLGDAVHISPGVSLAGGVSVGSFSWLGIGAVVIQQVCIGENVLVGAGSTVIGDIPDNIKAVGSPAKLIN